MPNDNDDDDVPDHDGVYFYIFVALTTQPAAHYEREHFHWKDATPHIQVIPIHQQSPLTHSQRYHNGIDIKS